MLNYCKLPLSSIKFLRFSLDFREKSLYQCQYLHLKHIQLLIPSILSNINSKSVFTKAYKDDHISNNIGEILYFHPTCSKATETELRSSFSVQKDFINGSEEENLIQEVEPHLKRLKYEFNHWDDAIHGYRETEKLKWSSKCSPILKKLKETSFKDLNELLPQVHVLDLSPDGVIKPHVDSVRFCGNIISGLCLLSDAVMRLVKEDEKDQIVDIFLPRRCLYIMRDASRYKYTHEILAKESSFFNDKYVERSRRVSIICRNQPSEISV